MQYYLVRLSYSASALEQMIDQTPNRDQRLSNVVDLVKRLGGSFANYHFFEGPYFDDPGKRDIVICKFVPLGKHDIVTILTMPDNKTARAFVTIVSAEPGVKSIEITPMISLDEMLADLGDVKTTKSASGYTAPGR